MSQHTLARARAERPTESDHPTEERDARYIRKEGPEGQDTGEPRARDRRLARRLAARSQRMRAAGQRVPRQRHPKLPGAAARVPEATGARVRRVRLPRRRDEHDRYHEGRDGSPRVHDHTRRRAVRHRHRASHGQLRHLRSQGEGLPGLHTRARARQTRVCDGQRTPRPTPRRRGGGHRRRVR